MQGARLELLVHINQDGVDGGVNPFDSGSRLHTDVMKTQALKQALDKYRFDAAFGGARRDEEKSRAKERVFSLALAEHRWDPKNQRPEPWRLYNTRKRAGESFRVFPLSNWTEADVWDYIAKENIPVVPLYFAKPRPVVRARRRADHARRRAHEAAARRAGRNLMCALPHARLLSADRRGRERGGDLAEIIAEMRNSRSSEREGRVIDHDGSASMEQKKQEGYF